MASRASIYAVIILLVTLGLVFVLVGNNGVSTGVYLPDQPTTTPAPTAGPSPTPLPDPAVENWQETAPGQLSYLPRPESGAQVFYNATTLDAFVQNLGVEMPPADAPYPLLSALETLRSGFEDQITEMGLDAGPNALDGPVIELVNGVPVSRLRVRLDAQESAAGGPFPGLDLLIGLIERPNDEIEVVQYRLQESPDQAIYQDFRAWLDAEVVELAGSAEDVDPAAEEPAVDTPADEPAEETTSEPVEDAEATEPGAPPTEEPAAPDDNAPADAETTGAGPWNEVAPGVLTYAADPAVMAQIAHRSMPVEEFVTGSGFELPAEDSDTPMLDLLTQLRDTLAGQLTAQGVTLADDAFEGPEAVEIAGKPAARLRLVVPAQTPPGGQPFPGLDIEILLVALDDDQLTAIQYTYQGALETSVYQEFETWLDENAARVTVPAAGIDTPLDEGAPGEAPEGATEEAAEETSGN